MTQEEVIVTCPALGFPWLSHLTLAESATVERWREKWNDRTIAGAKFWMLAERGHRLPGRKHAELVDYLARNPRAGRAAA